MFRSDDIKSRVFLVGCPRSGTTLLQALLSAHPDICSFPESHFFPHLQVRRFLLRRLGIAAAGSRRFLEQYAETLEMPRLRLLPFDTTKKRYREFRHLLDVACLAKGACCWVEKTPRHLHYIRLIRRLDPRAKFIHIIRTGPHVVASLCEVTQEHPQNWGGQRSIDTCLFRWLGDVETSLFWVGRAGHTHLLYEDLVENPEKELQRVCEFIGVNFLPEMLRNYQDDVDEVSGGERWKTRVKQPIRSLGSEKAERVFTEKERDYVISRTASTWRKVRSMIPFVS